jgi:hypothetical protein
MRSLLPRLSLCLLVPLAGCATFHSQQFTGPNGHKAYLMQCSGPGAVLQSCETRAKHFCPNGYDTLDTSTGVPGLPQMNGGTLIAPKSTMAVECKA